MQQLGRSVVSIIFLFSVMALVSSFSHSTIMNVGDTLIRVDTNLPFQDAESDNQEAQSQSPIVEEELIHPDYLSYIVIPERLVTVTFPSYQGLLSQHIKRRTLKPPAS